MIQALDSRSCGFYLSLFDGRLIQEYLHALREHSEESYAHCLRAGLLCVDMGYGNSLGEESIRLVGRAGILHDIGKKDIDLEILAKPGKLSQEERRRMKGHVRLGYIALEGFEDDRVRQIIVMHHEFKRTSPYPRCGDDRREMPREGGERRRPGGLVCTLAQYLAAADIFDSLARRRAYKEAMPMAEIESILRAEFTGNQALIDGVLQRGAL